MNRQEFLRLVSKEIHFIFDRKSIEKELDEHISDSVEDLIEEGFSKEDAERIAVEQMGDAKELGKMLNQEHHPILGYLWMTSRVLLILLLIVVIPMGIFAGYQFLCASTPTVVENSVKVYPIDVEMNVSTHWVKFDNICVDEEGYYQLTYREWMKWNYSRARWSSGTFWIVDENGDYIPGASYSSSGFGVSEGYTEFEWPKDGILRVKNADGNQIEIDLEEYCDE